MDKARAARISVSGLKVLGLISRTQRAQRALGFKDWKFWGLFYCMQRAQHALNLRVWKLHNTMV